MQNELLLENGFQEALFRWSYTTRSVGGWKGKVAEAGRCLIGLEETRHRSGGFGIGEREREREREVFKGRRLKGIDVGNNVFKRKEGRGLTFENHVIFCVPSCKSDWLFDR